MKISLKILESNFDKAKTSRNSYTRNWIRQISKDAVMFWKEKEKAERKFKKPTKGSIPVYELYAPSIVGERSKEGTTKCENGKCIKGMAKQFTLKNKTKKYWTGRNGNAQQKDKLGKTKHTSGYEDAREIANRMKCKN